MQYSLTDNNFQQSLKSVLSILSVDKCHSPGSRTGCRCEGLASSNGIVDKNSKQYRLFFCYFPNFQFRNNYYIISVSVDDFHYQLRAMPGFKSAAKALLKALHIQNHKDNLQTE